MITQFAYLQAAAERRDRHWYLWTLVNMLRLVCCMANEAGLETVLSAAYSLKHETDMMKTFSSREEAFDKAKEMGLTPEQAAKTIRETPHGRVAFYDTARGQIVKPDGWQQPDFRSLIKVAQTEQGRSEVSCVLEHVKGVTMATPMIFTDYTHSSHFTFANQIGHEALLVTSRSEWHNFPCHSGTPRSRRWVHIHYCGCDINTQSVVEISEGSDIHVVADEHATAWEELYLSSVPSRGDPNRAPTEVAPSTPAPHDTAFATPSAIIANGP